MSERAIRLRVSTPAGELELGPLVGLRFAAADGWRGVLPGHEPARARLREGPIRCLGPGERISWLASEGGVIDIDRFEVRITSSWAAQAETLAELRGLVDARDAERRRFEEEARSLAQRHEIATRRALTALERKVGSP